MPQIVDIQLGRTDAQETRLTLDRPVSVTTSPPGQRLPQARGDDHLVVGLAVVELTAISSK